MNETHVGLWRPVALVITYAMSDSMGSGQPLSLAGMAEVTRCLPPPQLVQLQPTSRRKSELLPRACVGASQASTTNLCALGIETLQHVCNVQAPTGGDAG